ncbi:PP2C family protein-serine/threonine phosphatase [Embleya sp. NPDC001921]
MDRPSNGAGALGALIRAGAAAPLEQLPDLIDAHARSLGLGRALVYLVDVRQDVLRLLPRTAPEPADDRDAPPAELRVEATVAGRAFQSVEPVETATGPDGTEPDGTEPDATEPADPRVPRLWLPLLDGADRLGVLGLAAEHIDDDVREHAGDLSRVLALLLVSRRAYGDAFARLTRTRRMGLAAELQWSLMPPGSFADEHITVSAAMEPAYEMGGDAYEYAIEKGRTAHLAVFDAMGHDTAASLTAALALAGCRNSRRRQAGPTATSEAIEAALLDQFGRSRYATAILAELDLRSGLLTWVNRGHHPPVVMRNGKWVATLDRPPAHPMGTDLGLPVVEYTEQLEPGDWLLLYTDGVTEARNPRGETFGLDRFVDFVIRRIADALPAPETLRRLIRAIRDYHEDHLQDDATILLLRWHGPTAT